MSLPYIFPSRKRVNILSTPPADATPEQVTKWADEISPELQRRWEKKDGRRMNALQSSGFAEFITQAAIQLHEEGQRVDASSVLIRLRHLVMERRGLV